MSDRISLRKWKGLPFHDARSTLVGLGRLQSAMDEKGISPTVDDLRTREFREYLEHRQAAIFAYLIGHSVLRTPVGYAKLEEEDYDCVFCWKAARRRCFVPVQLKEVVPHRLNPSADISTELGKLAKYVTSRNTVVAVHLNQSGPIDFSALVGPKTTCAEIWIYGAASSDQSKWFLFGNLLARPRGYEIAYPTQLSGADGPEGSYHSSGSCGPAAQHD